MKTFYSAILAGICIGIGGFANLSIGGIWGSILFTFGLVTVVHYKYKLFTGTAGFISYSTKDITDLLVILLGNILGAISVGLLTKVSPLDINGNNILLTRINNGWFNNGLLAIGCGFMMTTAVKFARENKFLPLIFAVPCFIICGFPHSIADAFYYASCDFNTIQYYFNTLIESYIAIVIGNFIGCNLSRWILPEN